MPAFAFDEPQQAPRRLQVGPDQVKRQALIELLRGAQQSPPLTPAAGAMGVATSAINGALDQRDYNRQLAALQNLIGGWNTTVIPGA
jgi:hypothetical protein